MLQSRRTRDSTRARRLTGAGVLLGVTLAAAWPAASPAGAVTTATFLYSGSQQQFVVPAGVTSVHVLAVGGRGGDGLAPGGGAGGAPAEVSGDLEVIPGQTLYVEVGGVGIEASSGTLARAFNGGDFAGMGAAGGGGASDVRLISRPENDAPSSLFSRLVVAAGGGGGGEGVEGVTGGTGGQAGSEGSADSTGAGAGGGAGTEQAGGIGACINRTCDGTLGSGRQGSVGMAGSAGGGGGGGLFGGAGGTTNGKDTGGAGGGGGSSLQPAGGTTVVPAAAAAPQVQISYVPPSAPITRPKGPPPSPPPSNIFALLRPVIGADGSITLVLDLEGPGTVRASATGSHTIIVKRHGRRTRRKVSFTYGRAAVVRQLGGVLELTIKPSLIGRKALKAAKRLPLAIAVTFAPGGASPATRHANVTVTRR